MKQKEYTVLIIDDHPLIYEAYKSALNYISEQDKNISFTVKVAEDCDTAYKIIKEYSTGNENLDIIFLDISLPPSKDGKILSGEDLGLKINELLSDTKIIVSTTFNDNYRVHSIFKSINPNGFLIKNDINTNELVTAINAIITNTLYYSKTVIKLLRKEVSSHFLLDDIDRKILYELSVGTMMKDLPDVVFMSLPGIERRKRRLKEIFNTKSNNDKELIFNAKEKGFI